MQNKKHSRYLFLFSFFLFLSSFIFHLTSCKKSTEPLFNVSHLQLQVLDVSCTEAWLSLRTEIAEKTEKDSAEWKLNLFRNDSLIISKPFTASDSIIYTDGLQPATTYSFSAKLLKNGKLQATSNQVTATTMDTTSHDFTWQIFEFGGQERSSSFFDVAIIAENDIWAVGEIYTKDSYTYDSLGNWIDPYNAAHWDGEKWELKRIYWNYNGDKSWSPIHTILAFYSDDIWFGGTHWDGNKFISKPMNIDFPYKINSVWGNSSTDFYVVGNSGAIAHYDGYQWQRIESGTKVRLLDIYGENKKIWVCGWEDLPPTVLLKIENGKVKKIIESESILREYASDRITGAIFSLWVDSHNNLYVLTWNSLYRCYHGNISKVTALWKGQVPSQWAYRKVRGNSANDIVTVGERGRTVHFNGVTWKQYNNLLNSHNSLYGVSIRDNLIVAVGERYINGIESYGIIYVGKR